MALLRDLRIKAGLSQREVGKQLGLLSPQYLSNAERGLNFIAPRHWRKLSKLYKVDTKVFFDAYMKREEKICRRYL